MLTGIGHSTNLTVIEMVAYENAITPTGLGEYLIQKFHDFTVPVLNAQKILVSKSVNRIKDEKLSLYNSVRYFRSVTGNLCANNKLQLEQMSTGIKRDATLLIRNEYTRMTALEKNISIMDPVQVLKRGYSITLLNGRLIRNIGQLTEGDVLKTVISDGTIISTVKTTEKSDNI